MDRYRLPGCSVGLASLGSLRESCSAEASCDVEVGCSPVVRVAAEEPLASLLSRHLAGSRLLGLGHSALRPATWLLFEQLPVLDLLARQEVLAAREPCKTSDGASSASTVRRRELPELVVIVGVVDDADLLRQSRDQLYALVSVT